MGSGGAAQPRKVGQPKPSISSAAQLQSKKERKKEREAGKTGTERATERKNEKPETNVPFLPFDQDKI